MIQTHLVISILGSAGGVAKAFLSIINKSAEDVNDPLHNLISNCKFHLIDNKQKGEEYYRDLLYNMQDKFFLHQFDLSDTVLFTDHLKSSKTEVVIDVSWADTVEMIDCCNRLGVYYINTAIENSNVDENDELFYGFPLIERIRVLEENKNKFKNTKAIIGSGMNPGVVQWMALELLKKYPDEEPLGCYIIEHDTTFYENEAIAKKDAIYTSWSPECFLDEAVSSYPMLMLNNTPLFLYEKVYNLEFKVTLGKKIFYGSLMPHEEIYSLCKLNPMEGGFIYRINEHTTNILKSNLYNVDDIWDLQRNVLDPTDAPLKGTDLVGVLIVYDNKERYIYNELSNKETFCEYQTNATYFQVGCGLYAALSTLLLDELPFGAYYVDELLLNTNSKYGEYLSYYMSDFVEGENSQSDGLLLKRMKRVAE